MVSFNVISLVSDFGSENLSSDMSNNDCFQSSLTKSPYDSVVHKYKIGHNLAIIYMNV